MVSDEVYNKLDLESIAMRRTYKNKVVSDEIWVIEDEEYYY